MENKTQKSSRLPNFYELSRGERGKIIANFSDLNLNETKNLENFFSLDESLSDSFVENAVGTFSLPLGVATNFLINKDNYIIPMAVEESSVIAAASYGAKLVRAAGGFAAHSSEPIMTGQVQFFPHPQSDWKLILTKNKQTRNKLWRSNN